MLTALQCANTWDEDGLRTVNEVINPVSLQHASSRLEAILFGVPPLVLVEFEEIQHRLQLPLAQDHYGLDLGNYLWSIKD
jgi:hypothetical protein